MKMTVYIYIYIFTFKLTFGYLVTLHTASLAAIARISAHETMPGHCFSSSSFISSISSNPRKLKFAGESLSALFCFVELRRTDPSHPYLIEQIKNSKIKKV